MWSFIRVSSSLFVGLVMAMNLVGCGSDSGSTSSGGGSLGGLNVFLTDAPTDEVSSVVVAITGLKIKRSGDSVERSIFNETRQIDLLTLQNSTDLLVATSVPAGTYQFIEVNLDQGKSHIIVNGSQQPLKVASEKIKVLGGFEVEAGGQTNVVLDFDAKASLVKQGNGNWLLKPVIVKK